MMIYERVEKDKTKYEKGYNGQLYAKHNEE